MAKKLTRSA